MQLHVHNNETGHNHPEWYPIHNWNTKVRYITYLWHGTCKNWSEVPRAIIAMLSDCTLWHQRMGHIHQCVIKHPRNNMEGGPNQTSIAPTGACEGWKKGNSKRLPFPPSKSRAKWPLDLIHSNLDEMPVLSIGGYKYATTYLDNHSLFGVIFYLKKKSEEFAAFRQYKAWAERQLRTTLKCKWCDQGRELLSNEQKSYLAENGIELQLSMPDSPQQNGCMERFQQTIVNGAEAMRWRSSRENSEEWITGWWSNYRKSD